jgi:hypothetical protein
MTAVHKNRVSHDRKGDNTTNTSSTVSEYTVVIDTLNWKRETPCTCMAAGARSCLSSYPACGYG